MKVFRRLAPISAHMNRVLPMTSAPVISQWRNLSTLPHNATPLGATTAAMALCNLPLTNRRRMTPNVGRHFSSDHASADLSNDEVMTHIKDLDKRRRFRAVYDCIKLDPRVRMPFAEFIALCEHQGIEDAADVKELATALNTSGLILYFGDHVPLILKPDTVTRAFLDVIDLKGEHNAQWVAQKQGELKDLLVEIEPLEKTYVQIRDKANTHALRVWKGVYLYVIGHCIVIPYLTFWYLSWDIMEPVTYMFNLWTLFLATYFYRKTKFEFTYESINEAIVRLKCEKQYKKLMFDIENYEELRDKIADIEDDLFNPEWEALKHVHPGIPDTIKLVHKSPLELLEHLNQQTEPAS